MILTVCCLDPHRTFWIALYSQDTRTNLGFSGLALYSMGVQILRIHYIPLHSMLLLLSVIFLGNNFLFTWEIDVCYHNPSWTMKGRSIFQANVLSGRLTILIRQLWSSINSYTFCTRRIQTIFNHITHPWPRESFSSWTYINSIHKRSIND